MAGDSIYASVTDKTVRALHKSFFCIWLWSALLILFLWKKEKCSDVKTADADCNKRTRVPRRWCRWLIPRWAPSPVPVWGQTKQPLNYCPASPPPPGGPPPRRLRPYACVYQLIPAGRTQLPRPTCWSGNPWNTCRSPRAVGTRTMDSIWRSPCRRPDRVNRNARCSLTLTNPRRCGSLGGVRWSRRQPVCGYRKRICGCSKWSGSNLPFLRGCVHVPNKKKICVSITIF